MKKKIIIIALILLALATLAFTMAWECNNGESCHALLYSNSTIWLLCANGEFDLVQNGPDTWEIHCNSHAYMPMVSK